MEGSELSTLKSYERVAKGLAYVRRPHDLLGDDGQGEYRDRSGRSGERESL